MNWDAGEYGSHGGMVERQRRHGSRFCQGKWNEWQDAHGKNGTEMGELPDQSNVAIRAQAVLMTLSLCGMKCYSSPSRALYTKLLEAANSL